jgi:transcriptional regulator with GAF, ATPase, and Fis domain
LLGSSAAFRQALEYARRLAASSLPVLLLGETGTGKDVFARHLHACSGRRGAFVAVNCAALPSELAESALFGHRKGAFTGATSDAPGYFPQAQGGTLFLDEIGELPLIQQAKLLRVLESHELTPVGATRVVHTDARIIAATNVDLEAAVAAGRFRNDLYARLAVTVIRLPPLRLRRIDILPLAARFLAEQAPGADFVLSAHAAEMLLLHPWPRNIRELRTVTARLGLAQPAGGEVSSRDLEALLDHPSGSDSPSAPPAARPDVSPPRGGPRAQPPEREELLITLRAMRGNINRIAEHYGKDPKQVYRWLKRHQLDPDDYR